MKVVIYNDKTKALSCTYRRGYSVSKRLVKLTVFKNFPWTSRQTPVIICVASSTLICWLGAHQCEIS